MGPRKEYLLGLAGDQNWWICHAFIPPPPLRVTTWTIKDCPTTFTWPLGRLFTNQKNTWGMPPKTQKHFVHVCIIMFLFTFSPRCPSFGSFVILACNWNQVLAKFFPICSLPNVKLQEFCSLDILIQVTIWNFFWIFFSFNAQVQIWSNLNLLSIVLSSFFSFLFAPKWSVTYGVKTKGTWSGDKRQGRTKTHKSKAIFSTATKSSSERAWNWSFRIWSVWCPIWGKGQDWLLNLFSSKAWGPTDVLPTFLKAFVTTQCLMPAMEYYCFFMELFFVGHAARQVEPNLHVIHKSTLLKPAYQVRQK